MQQHCIVRSVVRMCTCECKHVRFHRLMVMHNSRLFIGMSLSCWNDDQMSGCHAFVCYHSQHHQLSKHGMACSDALLLLLHAATCLSAVACQLVIVVQ